MPGRHSHHYAPRSLTFADVMSVRKISTDWFGAESEKAEYILTYPSSQVKYDDFDDVKNHWKIYGNPIGFRQHRWNSGGRETIFDATNPTVIVVEAHSSQLDPVPLIKEIAFALNLQELNSPPHFRVQTAFVAVRFNDEGKPLAHELVEMLATVGIAAETAEEFTGEDIPDKVKRLICEKDLFVGIVVPQSDKAWIVSEATFAEANGKPIVIADQDDAGFNPGILGKDKERVPFPRGQFSKAFLPILQFVQRLRSKTAT